ncbi:hypothetical protein PVAP13_1NG215771 [Panicum virgatum]|uniref:Uncharacterized protein n=1 Tax=Panicum virgatum TaxID=38727 RepID=A0A8T0WVX7_PANVG|nr:hypothetical protein PVAP13_1NG215771 [Panicum virgatum]
MATVAACWSKLTRSSSIIVLLVAVALAMAPIAHQSDDLTTNMTDQSPGKSSLGTGWKPALVPVLQPVLGAIFMNMDFTRC